MQRTLAAAHEAPMKPLRLQEISKSESPILLAAQNKDQLRHDMDI